MGNNGITTPVLSACMDILAKHHFVRVRVGEGREERQQTAALLAALLDCTCIAQVRGSVGTGMHHCCDGRAGAGAAACTRGEETRRQGPIA